MAFIVDSSVVAAWAIEDEKSEAADRLLTRAEVEGIVYPILLWYEIRNVLVGAERRKRIKLRDSDEFLARLEKIPAQIASAGASQHTMRLSRLYGLTAYDAAYLEVAIRSGLPIATFDRELARAARTEGIPVYPV